MTLVVDASALVLAAVERDPTASALRNELVSEPTHAPHLIDAEFGSVLRRQVLRNELDAGICAELLTVVPFLVTHRHAHRQLVAAAWSLRETVSFYDGLYVALAAALGAPLLTADARLAKAPGLPCEVRLA